MSNLNNHTKEFGRVSSLPTAALVLAFLIPIVGAIMGHVAMSQMKTGQISPLNRGQALAAVILGWSFTALAALLLPILLLSLGLTGFFGSLTYN
jgi:hypothetical protein